MKASKKYPDGNDEFSITVEIITPAIAKLYLEMNGRNRRIAPAQVKKWVRAMNSGQWRLTGEGIKFDTKGQLIDGQHRLTAVVESGVSVEMAVARNCAEDVFHVLDEGKRRSGGDVITILGGENTQATAAALKIIKAYAIARLTNQPLTTSMAAGRLANFEIPDWYEAHAGIADWIGYGNRIHRKVPASCSASAVSAALYLGSQVNHFDTKSFAEALVNGDGLIAGEAPLLLLNRSPIRGINTSGEAGQAITFLLVGKAINLWWAGKNQASLPFNLLKLPNLGDVFIPDISKGLLER